MFSKRQEKLIRSLQNKKFRNEFGLFTIEGMKLLEEALKSSVELNQIYCTESYAERPEFNGLPLEIISEREMGRISNLSTPPGILAIVKIPKPAFKPLDLILYLDGISDPGNMGTIIRTAEGFGVSQFVLSKDCVEIYSPKVVQASMGSIFRTAFIERELKEILNELKGAYHFYAAEMNGENIYEASLKTPAMLIMGSESHGVTAQGRTEEIQQLSIPISEQLESLNVSIANAIILSEFKRRSLL